MTWEDAIIQVLREEGNSMSSEDIANKILGRGYKNTEHNDNPKGTVGGILSKNEKGLFEHILEEGKCKGKYKLIDTFVTAPHSTVSRVVPPVVVRPCSSYAPSDPKYKRVSDFVKDSSVLSPLEMNLLELIVNFRLLLEKGEVCFADILNKLEVEILEEEGSRSLSVDATILREKLGELKEQIADMEREAQWDSQLWNLYGPLLNPMHSAAEKAEQCLQGASDGKIEFEIPLFGKFVSGNKESKPKVVIYLKSIEKSIRGIESRWSVMASVFVHEMFHAWNYFIAGGRKSVLAIDEPMVEFATLYFLKELEAFTKAQKHSLKNNVLTVRSNRASRVHNKQQSIGDVAAYGFGYYLFNNLSDDDSIKWIETYSKKSASISRDSQVKKAEEALIPVYPFKSENKVLEWFEKIIFSGRATLSTTGMSTATKVGLDVSLRDLVLACIKTIGRKCFDVQELYAFAPIFKVCLPECKNLESALKQQLDELVKEGHLDTLPNDCYSVKRD